MPSRGQHCFVIFVVVFDFFNPRINKLGNFVILVKSCKQNTICLHVKSIDIVNEL